MMKPEPSEVTWRGRLELGPRKFLNRSSSGEPGGNCGMVLGGGAFKVWLVEILTTVGNSLLTRSAKESGAGRAQAGAATSNARTANRLVKGRIRGPGNTRRGIGSSLGSDRGNQQAKSRFLQGFLSAQATGPPT